MTLNVNGHVTFVAPRVAGQVSRVLVDDNMRVKKGDSAGPAQQGTLPGSTRDQASRRGVGNADLTVAKAQVRGLVAQIRANRFQLERAIEDVHTQVALSGPDRPCEARRQPATAPRADFNRAQSLYARSAIAKEEFDQRREAERVAEALCHQAEEEVRETRVALGLPGARRRGPVRRPRRP